MPAPSIDILCLQVGLPAEKRTILNNLKTMQNLVGGYIESLTICPDAPGEGPYSLDIIMNEDGKRLGFDINFPISGDYVVGDVFLVRTNRASCEIESLTQDDIIWFTKHWEPFRYLKKSSLKKVKTEEEF